MVMNKFTKNISSAPTLSQSILQTASRLVDSSVLSASASSSPHLSNASSTSASSSEDSSELESEKRVPSPLA